MAREEKDTCCEQQTRTLLIGGLVAPFGSVNDRFRNQPLSPRGQLHRMPGVRKCCRGPTHSNVRRCHYLRTIPADRLHIGPERTGKGMPRHRRSVTTLAIPYDESSSFAPLHIGFRVARRHAMAKQTTNGGHGHILHEENGTSNRHTEAGGTKPSHRPSRQGHDVVTTGSA
jgi:hypothetical protein